MKTFLNEIVERLQLLRENIKKVIVGKDEVIEYVIVALLSRGNILLEDVPGVGKTVLAKSLAESIELDFRRIQFTPDTMPSDVLGVNVFNPKTLEFEFKPGPIFTNILLADEINRTSPRTQAGLLEAMDEGKVTIDGTTYELPKPFMVIATQNPREHFGTYPLPESQLDRFFISLSMGYLPMEEEVKMLENQKMIHPLERIEPVWKKEDLIKAQDLVKEIYIDKDILRYIVNIVNITRDDSLFSLGAGPRASISLMRGAQGYALLSGRDYVIPEDVIKMAVPILVHRVIPKEGSNMGRSFREDIIRDVLKRVKIPKVRL
ncbi:MAG: AAA family ATPase [Dictyoglomus turgidum]